MNVQSKSVSIYSVAKLAKVSPATVSRVLNNSASVNQNTREKVLKIIKESGFQRRQVRNRAGKIGFVMIRETTTIDNYTSQIMEGIISFCTQSGFDLSMIHLTPAQAESETVIKTIMEHSCDVVILQGKNTEFLGYMQRASIPTILVGDKIELDNVYYIDTDNVQSSRQGMEHLFELGHRRIAIFCANMSSKDHDDRLQVYKETIEKQGIYYDPELIIPLKSHSSSMEAGRLTAMEYFAKENDITAIIAMSDEMTYGILRALHDLKIKVPNDISLVSFDDFPISKYIEPPLTTIRQPLFEIGEYAGKAAMTLINNSSVKNINKIIPTSLVVRMSTSKVGL